jgi:hypothetical protein
MGKRRRLEKLERRTTLAREREDARFSWPKYLRSLMKVLPKMLLVVLAAVVLQVFLLNVLKIAFFGTPFGQIVILLPLYFLMFRWVNKDLAQLRGGPSRPAGRK